MLYSLDETQLTSKTSRRGMASFSTRPASQNSVSVFNLVTTDRIVRTPSEALKDL